jgi:hypothetical protein
MTDPGDQYAGPEPLFDWEGGDDQPDPDMLHDQIRDLLHAYVENGGLTEAESADLVQCVDLLDDWLSAGFPLPAAWRLAGTRKAEAAPSLRREEMVTPSPDYL